ncbi:MAG: glutamate racemase [Beijerinckiaceae bacterium]
MSLVVRAVPTILVFDSGVGGLTVQHEIAKARPDARIVYVADNAAFPYGALSEAALIARVVHVIGVIAAKVRPDCVVIACNTASTLVLPHLRAQFAIPIVGTVPAIKPAARLSSHKIFAVLATPGTVRRDYTRGLINDHAPDCEVILVGAKRLAALAEQVLRSEPVDADAIREEIAPCFVTRARADGSVARTDVITLSCTHYPLLLPYFHAAAPWPVMWIDPARAIARRVVQLIGASGRRADHSMPDWIALFTSAAGLSDALMRSMRDRGFKTFNCEPIPLVLPN